MVTGIAPTGIAVDGDNVYLGDDPNEAIQFVTLTGQFAGLLQGFHQSNATPTELALKAGTLYWGDWFRNVELRPGRGAQHELGDREHAVPAAAPAS